MDSYSYWAFKKNQTSKTTGKQTKKPPPKAKQTKNAKTHTSWTHHFHAYILHQGYTKVPWLQAGKSSSSTKVVSPPQHYNILMGRHLPLESTFSASSHFKCSILPSFPTYNLQLIILVWGIDALGKLFSFLWSKERRGYSSQLEESKSYFPCLPYLITWISNPDPSPNFVPPHINELSMH